MTEARVRTGVGVFLLFSQAYLLGMVLFLWQKDRFLYPEMKATLELLTPMFAVYTTVAVKYFVSHRHGTHHSRQVSKTFAFLSIVLPVIFVLALAGVIYLKSAGKVFANMEQFQDTLGIVQASFAVYIGLIVSTLFESPEKQQDESR